MYIAISMQVLVTRHGYEKQYTLTPSRKRVAMSLSRNNRKAFARHSLQNEALRKQLLQKIERDINDEMKALCSDPAVVRRDIETLKSVTFHSLFLTLEQKAPVLMGILRACIPKTSANVKVVSLVCVAILMKTHQSITVIQMLISVILYAGHAGKQVEILHNDLIFIIIIIHRCIPECKEWESACQAIL